VCVIQLAMRMRHIILSSVVCLSVCLYDIFTTTSVRNISRSKQNSARC